MACAGLKGRRRAAGWGECRRQAPRGAASASQTGGGCRCPLSSCRRARGSVRSSPPPAARSALGALEAFPVGGRDPGGSAGGRRGEGSRRLECVLWAGALSGGTRARGAGPPAASCDGFGRLRLRCFVRFPAAFPPAAKWPRRSCRHGGCDAERLPRSARGVRAALCSWRALGSEGLRERCPWVAASLQRSCVRGPRIPLQGCGGGQEGCVCVCQFCERCLR